MSRWAFCLVGLLFAFSTQASTSHGLLINLESRIHPLPKARGSLIKSFTNHSQSYIYDQALAIMAFTQNKNQANARSLLKALKSLQMKDGSLYFSYYMDGTSPYPDEGDKRIAGAMSWVALAAVHYQKEFKSKEFLSFNQLLLNYLKSQLSPIVVGKVKTRALKFAPNDVKSTAFAENNTAALEHNLDAFAAFSQFARVNPTLTWDREVNDLRTFILSLWDSSQAHFWSGASFREGIINKNELYLDNQTWSLLALDSATIKELDFTAALELNCDVFFVSHKGVKGFMDSKPARGPAAHSFVWSEGTLGQVMAMQKLTKLAGKSVSCQDQNANDLLRSVNKMKQEDGGIAYATSSSNPDFTTASSVAGTAWLFFAEKNFNPFELY